VLAATLALGRDPAAGDVDEKSKIQALERTRSFKLSTDPLREGPRHRRAILSPNMPWFFVSNATDATNGRFHL
jgi:hypothetical protein